MKKTIILLSLVLVICVISIHAFAANPIGSISSSLSISGQSCSASATATATNPYTSGTLSLSLKGTSDSYFGSVYCSNSSNAYIYGNGYSSSCSCSISATNRVNLNLRHAQSTAQYSNRDGSIYSIKSK